MKARKGPKEKNTDPAKFARDYLEKHGTDSQNRCTLRYWRGEVWRWIEGCYKTVSKKISNVRLC
jgi:hypothetical protein